MADKNKGFKNITEKKYIDLLYMTPAGVNAKDIAELFKDVKGITVQLWEEMNVLELELPNQNSIDFETLDPDFKDPSDAAFVKNRGIKTIFALSLSESDLTPSIPLFEKITDKFSGFVCADTQDFKPVYAGTTVKTEVPERK